MTFTVEADDGAGSVALVTFATDSRALEPALASDPSTCPLAPYNSTLSPTDPQLWDATAIAVPDVPSPEGSTPFSVWFVATDRAGNQSCARADFVAGDSQVIPTSRSRAWRADRVRRADAALAVKLKLLPKLTLLALGISAVPLAIGGYSAYRIGESALRTAIDESELQIARQVGQHVSSEIDHAFDTLRVDARILDVTRAGDDLPTPKGIAKFLQLVYHQNDAFCAVALLNERAEPVGEPAFLENPGRYGSFKGHEAMRPSDVETLGLMAPLGDALNRGSGMGPVFVGGPAHDPHVVLAVAFRPSATGERRVLAAEMTLRGLAAHVESLATADTEVKLLDRKGRLIGAGRAGRFGGLLAPQHLPGVRDGESSPVSDQVDEYASAAGPVLGAYVPAPPYPFGVLVEKTVASALARVNRIRAATLLWIAISAVVGALIARAVARRIAGRVAELAEGSRQIAAGKLDVKLPVRSTDELGDLAVSFNRMTGALDSARREIVKQKDEILGWNQTLEKRVEDKTRELRQAQDLLLRSRALAALGELGSGVAHEINNPLAGVLGLSQLILSDLPGTHAVRPMIQDIEKQALRIRRIVSNLLRFAQRQGGEDFKPLDLQRVVEDAVELCGPSELDEMGVQLVRRYQPKAPRIRGSATQLQEAFIQLIQNARGAMPRGGLLTLETSVPHDNDNLVRVSISDTGRGIDPENLPRIFDPFFTTKSDWNGVGLGLSLVHKTIEDHGGLIQVQSEVGSGTTFFMTFPAQPAGAVLT